MSYDGEVSGGEFMRLPWEVDAPNDAFFTEADRQAANDALNAKRAAEPVVERLKYLVEQGVYPGADSQAAAQLRRFNGVVQDPSTPDL